MRTPEEILQQLGKRINTLRIDQGLSPEQLAQKSQVNTELILEIEEGKSDCDLLTLLHLATALDINVMDLFSKE